MATNSHLTYTSLSPPLHPPPGSSAQPSIAGGSSARLQPHQRWPEAGPSTYTNGAASYPGYPTAQGARRDGQGFEEAEGAGAGGGGGGGGGPSASSAAGKGKKASAGKGKKRTSGGADGAGANGAEKLDKDGQPKKKRKQLVACDSCRLRRVKCDKADKEGGPCSECEKKSITCTDSYVKNRPKVVRSGKLIAQAKLLYGDPHGTASSNSPQNGAPISPDSAVGGDVPSPVEDVRRASAGSASAAQAVTVKQGEGKIMGSQMSQDVAEQLINTFLTHLHPQCPLFDQDSFLQAYEAAGRSTDNMTPAHECLALVMQAWAARFSDHHLILGPGAPTLADVRVPNSAGGVGRDYTVLGNRRDTFAKAMAERAVQAVDRRGLLRTSSAVGCAALTLLEFLLCFDDPHRIPTRGRYILSSAVEHLRNLQLGQCDEPGEECLPPERAANGTMLWFVYTRDASASMFGGRNPSLTDDDLALLCDLFVSPFAADPEPFVSSTDPRMLSGIAVASIFRHSVTSIRNTIARLTGPLARRQRIEESVLHELWAELDETARLAATFHESANAAMLGPEYKSDIWFRDLTVLRSQHTLGIHLSIIARLTEEETTAALAQEQQQPEENGPYLELLRRMKRQSDARLLIVSREFTELLSGFGNDLIFLAPYSMEYSAYFLNCMVESLTWEQGGEFEGWTWANKVEEVSALIECLKLIGWCWPGYDRLIESARTSLAEQAAILQQTQQQQQQQHDRRASEVYSTHSGYEQQAQPTYLAQYQQAAYPSTAAPPSTFSVAPPLQPGDYAFSSLSASSFPPTPTPSPGYTQQQLQNGHQLLPPTQDQQHLQPSSARYAYPPQPVPSGGLYASAPAHNGGHGM